VIRSLDTQEIVDAIVELRLALLAREATKQAAHLDRFFSAVAEPSVLPPPFEVRQANDRVSRARLALDLVLLESS
jgi:hypothetical protein